MSVNANSYVDVNVAFGSAFSDMPAVVVSGAHSGKAGNSGVILLSTTTTGFSLRVYNNSVTAGSVSYRWIAVPYK